MYENEEFRGEKTCMPAPNGSMTDLLRETSCIASDVLAMSHKINGCLFGNSEGHSEGKAAEPRCFHDELEKQRRTLMMTAETLSVICSRLGI